jgi:hypothetical protein
MVSAFTTFPLLSNVTRKVWGWLFSLLTVTLTGLE